MVMFTLELPNLLQSEELSLAGKEMFPHVQTRAAHEIPKAYNHAQLNRESGIV